MDIDEKRRAELDKQFAEWSKNPEFKKQFEKLRELSQYYTLTGRPYNGGINSVGAKAQLYAFMDYIAKDVSAGEKIETRDEKDKNRGWIKVDPTPMNVLKARIQHQQENLDNLAKPPRTLDQAIQEWEDRTDKIDPGTVELFKDKKGQYTVALTVDGKRINYTLREDKDDGKLYMDRDYIKIHRNFLDANGKPQHLVDAINSLKDTGKVKEGSAFDPVVVKIDVGPLFRPFQISPNLSQYKFLPFELPHQPQLPPMPKGTPGKTPK